MGVRDEEREKEEEKKRKRKRKKFIHRGEADSAGCWSAVVADVPGTGTCGADWAICICMHKS